MAELIDNINLNETRVIIELYNMGISSSSIEKVRQFVRSKQFVPLSDEELEQYKYSMREADHNSAIDGNPMDEEDLAFWEMICEERTPSQIREAALDYLFNEVEANGLREK